MILYKEDMTILLARNWGLVHKTIKAGTWPDVSITSTVSFLLTQVFVCVCFLTAEKINSDKLFSRALSFELSYKKAECVE